MSGKGDEITEGTEATDHQHTVVDAPGGVFVGTDPKPVPVVPTTNTTNLPPKTFTAEEIEKARIEEKNKLYPRLEAMDAELKELRAERERREKLDKEQKALELAKAKQEEEEALEVRELLERRDAEWNARFQDMELARERERAVFEQERQFAELQAYKSRRMAEEADNILPELRDYIDGSTPEEVDQRIQDLQDRSSKILSNAAEAMGAARGQMRGVGVASPSVGPLSNESVTETVSPDDIRNMDMATYSKNRAKLLGAASRQANDRGLYG